ncbi:MAG: c-type cytochrome [Planctomycetes bacterium]|nr:c-type cytochrome [Planctomycetota bacterium]
MAFEKWSPVVVLALAALFLAAGLIAREPAEVEPDDPPQEFDEQLARSYVEAGCWQCHSVSTVEARLSSAFGALATGVRPTGPDLAGVGARYHPDWHEAHFWKPDDVYAGSQMPAQRHLFVPGTPQKLNGLGQRVVAFLLTLKTPSRLTKPWPQGGHVAPEGDAERGAELFRRECAGCHGADGLGDGPAARFFDRTRKPPALARGELILQREGESRRDTIYGTITNGLPLTGMPSFGNRLSAQERSDLTDYVLKISGK